MNQNTKNFIDRHVHDDIYTLALKAQSYHDVDITLAIRQIEGKQKTERKVPVFYRCTELLFPPKLSLEQSSSEVTSRYKSTLCSGNKLVDLTGGFGIDCFFMSEKFKNIVYIEKEKELCKLAKHNFKVLGRDCIEVVNETAERFLETDFDADWIFIDPARRKSDGTKAVLLSDCEPNIALLQKKLLIKAENVLIKLSPMFDLVQLQRELHSIKTIHIVAIENECKEILVVLKRNYNENIKIKAIHFLKNKNPEWLEFDNENEKALNIDCTKDVEKYLYEPNCAILKSGAFKTISHKYNLHKLHTNSHLYTSEKLLPEFQGRIFEVKNVIDYKKSNLKKMDIPKANLTTRNFPLTVAELRKKLNINEGGDDYIFATTLSNNNLVLINCKKLK
ncbi:MAG: THUMP-like domain-containing protein [Paludibacteraceae bacterium]